MKILMLAHRFPYPATRGDCIRSWGELQYLAERHDVWFACVDRKAPSADREARVRSICRSLAVVVRPDWHCMLRGGWALLRGGSLLEGYFRDARLVEVLKAWSSRVRFDAVLTFSPAMAQYAALVPAARRVLDMNDVESHKLAVYARRSHGPVRALYGLEARRLRAAEQRWGQSHDVCLMVNERERGRLLATARPRRVEVVRTGVGVSDAGVSEAVFSRSPKTRMIASVGSMSYMPNVRAVDWFGEHVWPTVKAAVPEAEWYIVGSRPTRRVRRWGRLRGVTVTGFVPDVEPYLRSADVFVCPVDTDIGIQTKLIEAMAHGKACVVTPPAAEGIDFEGEAPFLVGDTPEAFAEAVLRLLRERSLAVGLGARAEEVARRRFSVEQQGYLVEQWLLGRAPSSLAPGVVDPGQAPDAAPPKGVLV